MESGAGSTMLKFGLLFLLANCFLKLFLGIGIWKMAMENKAGMKSSIKYEEERGVYMKTFDKIQEVRHYFIILVIVPR